MEWSVNFLFLYAIAIPGWLLFRFLKLPASAMLGSMIAAGLLSINGCLVPDVPMGSSFLFQIILGSFVGLGFTKDLARELKRSIGTALFASFWWISFPMVLGFLISECFGIDIATCVLGTVPGGVAEMSIFAISMNADAALVALMQFFRVLGTLIAIPIISAKLNKHTFPQQKHVEEMNFNEFDKSLFYIKYPFLKQCLTFFLAMISGSVFFNIGIPVGGFVGSIFVCAVGSLAGFPLKSLPKYFRNLAQLGLGALIGLRATPETIVIIKSMFFTILLSTVIMILWGIILAFVVKKFTKWDLITCLLASSPAGVTQLAAVADDLGADPLKVSFLQLVRLLTALLVLPPLIKALL